jgi:hypothetical protein
MEGGGLGFSVLARNFTRPTSTNPQGHDSLLTPYPSCYKLRNRTVQARIHSTFIF